MTEKTEQNLRVIDGNSQEMREKEVIGNNQSSCQTNPIRRKLLDFSVANKTSRFSVRDWFKR